MAAFDSILGRKYKARLPNMAKDRQDTKEAVVQDKLAKERQQMYKDLNFLTSNPSLGTLYSWK